MSRFLFVLGVIDICRVAVWGFDFSGKGHGLTFGEIEINHDSKIPITEWSHDLPSSWNQINSISLDEGKPEKGLEGWLTDVVVGKNHDHPVKPIVKTIGYPVYKEVEIKIPEYQIQHVPQPYPVLVPMLQPVPYEVIKTVVKTVDKKVPTPVEKIVPVPIEKPVPFEVVKHVPVLVEKKIPIKIPVYKTIHHKVH